MRRIKFDDQTINEIREYIQSGHTIKDTCNKFTLKEDTLRRVMFENGIKAFYLNKSHTKGDIPQDKIDMVCNLFEYTKTPIQQICKQAKLEYYKVQTILHNNFTEQFISTRKSKLYSDSKIGDRNPMLGKCKEQHPNYKGIVDDGNGYYMVLKPEWYTGRKGSKHVFYHSVIMCDALGITEVPKGFIVHHIDGNPKNNDIDNLCLMTISGHSKFHSLVQELCKVQRLSDVE